MTNCLRLELVRAAIERIEAAGVPVLAETG